MKKPLPKGKKGKGIRALKKKAPHIAKKMGYKRGGRAKWQNVDYMQTYTQRKKELQQDQLRK